MDKFTQFSKFVWKGGHFRSSIFQRAVHGIVAMEFHFCLHHHKYYYCEYVTGCIHIFCIVLELLTFENPHNSTQACILPCQHVLLLQWRPLSHISSKWSFVSFTFKIITCHVSMCYNTNTLSLAVTRT